MAYQDFRQRYAILAAQEAMDPEPRRAGTRMCGRMEQEGRLKRDGFQCGESKVRIEESKKRGKVGEKD